MNQSYFFYIHKDLSGAPNVWKIGKAMTPYSACRMRQRLMSSKFALDYLYFGRPRDINRLETLVKDRFSHVCGTTLWGHGAQTELFQVEIDKMKTFISETITNHYKPLDVRLVELEAPYSATNSASCPFGIPVEKDSNDYLEDLVLKHFGEDRYLTKTDAKSAFNTLFEVDGEVSE